MLQSFTLGRACVAAGLLTLGTLGARAQSVSRDAAFGTAGSVATGLLAERFNFSPVAPGGAAWSVMGQTLVQPDGKIVVCAANANTWTVRRYHADGTPDAGFGANGSVTSAFPGNRSVASGLARQPDGKLVVVGGIRGDAGNVWAAARYTAQGQPDPGFGTAGLAYPDPQLPTGPTELARVVILPDGKLLAAASFDHLSPTRMVRLLANGQPDNSFGTAAGSGAGSPVGPMYYAMFKDMTVQPDGKILLVTHAAPGSPLSLNSTRIARLNANGTPDTGFGTNGETSVVGYSTAANGQPPLERPTAIHGVAVQPDGRILLVGSVSGSWESPILFRLNANGSADAAFNTAASRSFGTTVGGLAAVAVQSDGSIVVGGSYYPPAAQVPALLLARYSAAGVLDASFGSTPGLPAGAHGMPVADGGLVRTLTALPNDQLLAWEAVFTAGATNPGMRLTRYTAGRVTGLRPRQEAVLQLQPAPVPTAGELQLRYVLPAAAAPQATVRDVLGRVVATARAGQQAAGAQQLALDVQHLAAGSYSVSLEAGQWHQTTRIVKQ
ncbi:T9SS type A sorting domain-containing protein [Hymenobacter edaphi]|uniref:Secretion system C-terminal sorting domain-containing protein n=1 Tax=Hymenobacter edaphi TaxID=2211146 RepID=A0A328BWT3_9BACT|nr:T9SS type A sorting domain-containing protein [Hymenobacter edaphi]RAK70526.1 hypothetical protein DLM85_06745 [Hymenobacter edaphi]